MHQGIKNSNYRHGLRYHSLYNTWLNIKQRCTNPKSNSYKWYGGRGIRLCDEWFNNPANFINWCIKHGWKVGLEIDRIKNNGDYSPDNCRFVTHQENIINTRKLTISNTSGFKDVSWHSRDNVWQSRISVNGKRFHLGYFISKRIAALRYDVEAMIINDGRLMNFIEVA